MSVGLPAGPEAEVDVGLVRPGEDALPRDQRGQADPESALQRGSMFLRKGTVSQDLVLQ